MPLGRRGPKGAPCFGPRCRLPCARSRRDPAQTLMISLLHRTASSKTGATPPIRQPKSRTGGVALSAAQREAAQDRHSSVCAAFLFLFAGREVRLPSRSRALLARGSRDCLDRCFFGLLLLPIASLFASGHVNLLWLMNRLSPPGNYGLAIAGEQGYPRKKPQIDSYVGRQTRWIKVKNRGQPALERVLDFCRARAQ